MSFAARLLLACNRIFRRPIDTGDTLDAYSKWEHDTGRDMFQTHFAGEIDGTGKRWLDVGCGAGGKSLYYATLNPAQLIAVDILEANADQARSYAESAGDSGTPEFAAADVGALPFADEVFDIVTATDTFEHFVDPAGALREMIRVLKPGGRIAFYFTPHRSPLGSHLYNVIYLPWCHLFFGERVLFEAIEMALTREEVSKGSGDPQSVARERTAEMREYYRSDLNHMTVKRFLRVVDEVPRAELVWMRRKPLKTRFLLPLTRIPPFDELTTTLAIGLVRKRS